METFHQHLATFQSAAASASRRLGTSPFSIAQFQAQVLLMSAAFLVSTMQGSQPLSSLRRLTVAAVLLICARHQQDHDEHPEEWENLTAELQQQLGQLPDREAPVCAEQCRVLAAVNFETAHNLLRFGLGGRAGFQAARHNVQTL
jgi:hypothetical protein